MDFDEDRQELGKYANGLNRGHLTVCNYWAIKIGGDEVEDVMVGGLLSNYCGFWSNRTLPYFPLSVLRPPFVRPFVTGVTSQLFLII